ncbi:outer-membrane lipoprotein carrier protein LolA [Phenylobacterium sp.]|uniref:LolA family protein n=1 Tax=Phenylobacterium sp. TaxID=1871053 RepID=UPI00272FB7E9|nr:outer-membrane lipoprotein carrier protein LolA [Phenylobacterium sp.]MDP1872635.1 outer-membrane lipoprotein carrier protein LolA [Phenylobacterium sp.]MDP3300253.1 outer-membrane lipoprotein carrier protein LolA [Phenylobacterium sp.]
MIRTPALTRRTLAFGLAAAPFAGLLAAGPALAALPAADQALVNKAVAYLEGLTHAKGTFVQTDPRGVTTQGEIFLKRPGKARFAYAAPSGLLVVSDGSLVSVANSKLKTFESYPLGATPLSLFLARQIRLDRGVQVTRVTRLADGFSITARDGKKEAEGQITLTFSDGPMKLVGWTITDPQGQGTRVRLTRLDKVASLDDSLFVLKDPRNLRPGRARM